MAQTRSKPAMIPPPPHKKSAKPAGAKPKKAAPTVKDVRAAAQALLSLTKRVK